MPTLPDMTPPFVQSNLERDMGRTEREVMENRNVKPLPKYIYHARGSTHYGHTCVVREWFTRVVDETGKVRLIRGNVKAYCCDCDEWFIGIRRAWRKP